jgi:hypothetical protein
MNDRNFIRRERLRSRWPCHFNVLLQLEVVDGFKLRMAVDTFGHAEGNNFEFLQKVEPF